MIKEMRGWKVLQKNRFSANSILCNNISMLYYPPNLTISPKLADSKLFFFKDEEDAIRFRDRLANNVPYNFMIVPCIAYNCSKGKVMSTFNSDRSIERYWELKNRKKKTFGHNTPQGTWFADKIKCLA